MSSIDRTRGDPAGATDEPATPAGPPVPPSGGGEARPGNWADRMQRARARHAAITKNLNTWSSYKSWTEHVKDSWDDEAK